jgi:hypothetical protein
MLKAYAKNLLFFAAVSLSWVGAFLGDAPVEPVVDDESLAKSVGYSALSLVAWLGLLVGGVWAGYALAGSNVAVILVMLLVWGCLVAPVVVVVAMRLLFPGISRRLLVQLEKKGPARSGVRPSAG